MRKHDLTNKKTTTKTMTNTFKEHLQRAIFETFGLWDIWSEQWENMTWPTKRQQQRRRQIQWGWQKHLENTPNEGFLETFWEHPWMAIQENFSCSIELTKTRNTWSLTAVQYYHYFYLPILLFLYRIYQTLFQFCFWFFHPTNHQTLGSEQAFRWNGMERTL